MRTLARRLAIAVLALGAACRHAPVAPPAPAPLRVMTFNLRYDTPEDGVNAWPNRTDRLALLDSGTFWLSPTPEVAGSKGWDAAIERVATWARLRDRATGCAFLHLNTHFDDVGEQARQESARLIRRRLPALARGLPVVVTGDLNSDRASGAYRVLTRDTVPGAGPALVDAFAASGTGHYGPTSTWTAFRAIEPGRRIDYVLVSARVPVWSHGTLTDAWDGRYPSDHLPVLATLSPPCV